MEYNKVTVGFVVQSYRDGECVCQEFIASDEVSREDPTTGESIEVDVKAEQYQPMDLVQAVLPKMSVTAVEDRSFTHEERSCGLLCVPGVS